MKGLLKVKLQRDWLFGYVYNKIRIKHPKWTHGQISHCTAYALRYQKKKLKEKRNYEETEP